MNILQQLVWNRYDLDQNNVTYSNNQLEMEFDIIQ